jgi:hypothetical protein
VFRRISYQSQPPSAHVKGVRCPTISLLIAKDQQLSVVICCEIRRGSHHLLWAAISGETMQVTLCYSAR